jgi:hypothetical protein
MDIGSFSFAIFSRSFLPESHDKNAPGLLAGRQKISKVRKDGRSQRGSLANNLRANAADMIKTVHLYENGEPGAARQGRICGRNRRIRGLRTSVPALTGRHDDPN